MKRKILCIAIVVMMACVTVFSLPASAAQCYARINNVSGDWIMYWWGSTNPDGAIGYKFEAYPSEYYKIENLYLNAHLHTGRLTSYTSVDPNGSGSAPQDYPQMGAGYRKIVYAYSTAAYYGYLTCN